MSETLESLRRKIDSAGELRSVVRTMKAMAAASIGQYENAARSLGDYYHTVELGLAICLRRTNEAAFVRSNRVETTGAIVFGSDQGLVGQFNEKLAEFVAQTLRAIPGEKIEWAIGDRMQSRLIDAGFSPAKTFIVPNSVSAITPLIGQVLSETEAERETGDLAQVYVFHNRPLSGAAYEPVVQRLLPLDDKWRRDLKAIHWPTINLPEVVGDIALTTSALIREYVFVSLFKACAESLASENASRLAAMQRAEKNIDEMATDLGLSFHRLRQSSIDEELFDLISGFEALESSRKHREAV